MKRVRTAWAVASLATCLPMAACEAFLGGKIAPGEGDGGGGAVEAGPVDASMIDAPDSGTGPDADARGADAGGGDGRVDSGAMPDAATDSGSAVDGDAGAVAWTAVVHIQAGTSALPATYSVRIDQGALATATHLQANLANVHVVGPGGAEVDRYVDPGPSPPTALWFALVNPIAAGSDDTSYSLRYGDLDAGSPQAGASAVFQPGFWDFENGTPTDWRYPDAGHWVDGGGYVLPGGGTVAAELGSWAGVGIPGQGVQIVAQVTPPQSDFANEILLGFQCGGNAPAEMWHGAGPPVMATPELDTTSSSSTGTAYPLETGPTLFEVDCAPSQTRFVYGSYANEWTSTGVCSCMAGGSPVGQNITIDNLWDEPGATVTVEIVRARLVVDEEPTVTLGPEQGL